MITMKDIRALFMVVGYVVMLPLAVVLYGGLYIWLRARLGASHHEAKIGVLRTLKRSVEMNIEFIKYGFKDANQEG